LTLVARMQHIKTCTQCINGLFTNYEDCFSFIVNMAHFLSSFFLFLSSLWKHDGKFFLLILDHMGTHT